MRRRFITYNDYERLSEHFNNTDSKAKKSTYMDKLLRELLSATMFPQELIANTVVTMNSLVKLKALATGEEIELTITYPEDSNDSRKKISIFTPTGFALLGRMVGDQVSWQVPGGLGRFEIMEITYQPEAVGDYNL